MIVAIGGGIGGFKNYLETGQKKGRELHRDALDQRIALFGDLNVFELATSSQAGEGQKYDHITLAFSENHVPDEMLEIAVKEFRDHALAAWPESERHRIAFYAEAHRPKILSYINHLTGETVQRLLHIHVGMGKRDLLTGKVIEPLGFLGLSDNLKFIDAFQESFNAKYGFSSPKDNPKITPENAIDTLARYTGAAPDALGAFNQQKTNLEIVLQKQIIEKNIITWSGFEHLLKTHGRVSKMREGKFDEVFRILVEGADRAVRLKGVFFQRQFIERPTSEKLAIIQDKAKVAYLEQMQPRKEPAYVASVLKEWHTTKARENRFLHTGSKFYREQYLPADAETRLQLLNEIERKHHGFTSTIPNNTRNKITAPRDRLSGLPKRHLDGVQKRSEMLLRGDNGLHVREVHEGESDSLGVRQTDESRGNNGTNGSSDSTGQSSASSPNRGDSTRSGSNNFSQPDGRLGGLATQGNKQREPIFQPSSVVDRFAAELRDRYEQAADKERYAEIRKHINCTQLLNILSHSHWLNPLLYEVVQAKDGTPRVKAGSRHLTPSDFLTKELGLDWKEAAPILRKSYELQIGGKVTNPRSRKAKSTSLLKEFNTERNLTGTELKKRLKIFAGTVKATRAALTEKLNFDQKQELSGLNKDSREAKYSSLIIKKTTEKAELEIVLSERKQALRDSIHPTQADAWRTFLQQQVKNGNEEALAELEKIDDIAYKKQVFAATIGTIHLEDDEAQIKLRRLAHPEAIKILSQLVQTIGKNKEIIYQLNGQNVLQDLGRHLAILDENSEEAIAAGLLLAREKFGGNLTLTGSPAFQQRAVEIAVAQGFNVKFVNPQLEAMRHQLGTEKRLAERASKPIKVLDQYYDEALVGRLNVEKLKQANAAVPEKIEEKIHVVEFGVEVATEVPIIAKNEIDTSQAVNNSGRLKSNKPRKKLTKENRGR
jgi:Large polyvalent protein-associated domain 7